MSTNEFLLASQINSIDKKINVLAEEADYLNNLAKSDIKNYKYFKQAAEKYKELADTCEEYISLAEQTNSSKSILILKANMYHEKYDCDISYGLYYKLSYDFQKATSAFQNAARHITKANFYIEKVLEEKLTPNEKYAAEYDYNVWALDSLLIKANQLDNECNIAQENRDYATAYDKTKELIDLSQEIYTTTLTKKQYFSYEDQRRYHAQVEVMQANLFSINNMQSREDFNISHNRNDFIDMILYLTKSHEYTVKAIHINNFWSDYKTVRDNIYNNLRFLIKQRKNLWLSILEKSSYDSLIVEIMKDIDSKYYKKITNTGGLLNMNIFKNIVKTKGNVIVNNGNNNISSITQPDILIPISDINKLISFIDYLKSTPSDDFTSEEYIDIISKLNAIASAKTSEQQEIELKNWNTLKTNLSQSALKFLSLSSDIVTIGTFLKQLLGL